MELLLAVTEDSATLRSDMSAVYGVGGESDAIDIALSFLLRCTIPHHSPWKTSKRKTSGPGRAR